MAVLLSSMLLSVSALAQNAPGCTDNEVDIAHWQVLKANQFNAVAADEGLLAQLYACLAEPDPKLRDAIGYEGVVALLRNTQLTRTQQLALFERLTNDLTWQRNDEHGVFLPFVVLAYSEVMRADRINAYLEPAQRQQALDAIAGYVAQLQDYRGFDAESGWRHGVAHSADVLLQLALNPLLSAQQHQQIGDIIGQALLPNKPLHFYVYDEPARLARAFAFNVLSPEVDIEVWQQWLVQYSKPKGYDDWPAVFQSPAGLAQRHNKKAFFQSLYTTFANSQQDRLLALMPGLQQAIRALP
ncbi:MAG: DUF2785 domain-containing protein [Alteromonadaceae bacterium]|nr:DUF2785 domain-containing protein [Alteromonadaceae bacterium]